MTDLEKNLWLETVTRYDTTGGKFYFYLNKTRIYDLHTLRSFLENYMGSNGR